MLIIVVLTIVCVSRIFATQSTLSHSRAPRKTPSRASHNESLRAPRGSGIRAEHNRAEYNRTEHNRTEHMRSTQSDGLPDSLPWDDLPNGLPLNGSATDKGMFANNYGYGKCAHNVTGRSECEVGTCPIGSTISNAEFCNIQCSQDPLQEIQDSCTRECIDMMDNGCG
jgi:hypothetical protein